MSNVTSESALMNRMFTGRGNGNAQALNSQIILQPVPVQGMQMFQAQILMQSIQSFKLIQMIIPTLCTRTLSKMANMMSFTPNGTKEQAIG